MQNNRLTCDTRSAPRLEQRPDRRQERPLEPKHVWAIGGRLEPAVTHGDLAPFNLAIDSKLQGRDLVRMKVVAVMASGQIEECASGLQSKTQQPARVEISESTRALLARWMQEPLMVGASCRTPRAPDIRDHFPVPSFACSSDQYSISNRSASGIARKEP